MSDLRRTLAAAEAALPDTRGGRWHEALRRGTLRVGLYAPRGEDPQLEMVLAPAFSLPAYLGELWPRLRTDFDRRCGAMEL